VWYQAVYISSFTGRTRAGRTRSVTHVLSNVPVSPTSPPPVLVLLYVLHSYTSLQHVVCDAESGYGSILVCLQNFLGIEAETCTLAVWCAYLGVEGTFQLTM
jgi:hypothetical protein